VQRYLSHRNLQVQFTPMAIRRQRVHQVVAVLDRFALLVSPAQAFVGYWIPADCRCLGWRSKGYL
jgi:hypothetical protein